MAVTSEQQRMAAENLYRDANTLIYGDSNPSEDAIDRVVSKINKECVYLFCFSYTGTFVSCPFPSCFMTLTSQTPSIDKKGKFSRKRLNEEEGDITYINEHNRVFNKKVSIRFLQHLPVLPILTVYLHRLHDITTSILPRFEQVLSEVQLYSSILCRLFVYPLCIFFTTLRR